MKQQAGQMAKNDPTKTLVESILMAFAVFESQARSRRIKAGIATKRMRGNS